MATHDSPREAGEFCSVLGSLSGGLFIFAKIQPYERRFAEAREKYVLEREAWLKSLSPTGLRQYRSAVRKRRSRYRLKDASGQPLKRAPSAWNIFLRDSMASKPRSGEKIGVQLAAIAAEWRQLNGSEKAVRIVSMLGAMGLPVSYSFLS